MHGPRGGLASLTRHDGLPATRHARVGQGGRRAGVHVDLGQTRTMRAAGLERGRAGLVYAQSWPVVVLAGGLTLTLGKRGGGWGPWWQGAWGVLVITRRAPGQPRVALGGRGVGALPPPYPEGAGGSVGAGTLG